MAGKGGISKEYFNLSELSHYSGLGIRFLREAIKNPDHPLPHFRLNNKTILVSHREFAKWLEYFRAGDKSEVDKIASEVLENFRRTDPGGVRPRGGKKKTCQILCHKT